MAEFRHETDRLILRDWRDEDWAPFWRHLNTLNVMRHLGGLANEETRRKAQARLLKYNHDFGHTFWAVQRKDDGGHLAGEILGFCGLKRCTEENGPLGDMEAGWRLREDAWGHGYAKEAAQASLDLAFTRFDAPHVIALTVEENAPSWGLMRRLGMERRADMDFADAEPWAAGATIIVYLITKAAWKAANNA